MAKTPSKPSRLPASRKAPRARVGGVCSGSGKREGGYSEGMAGGETPLIPFGHRPNQAQRHREQSLLRMESKL